MKKNLLGVLAGISLIALVGCGGSSSGSSTVLMGSVAGVSGTMSGVTVRASQTDNDFSTSKSIEDEGSFSFSKVPSGLVEVKVDRTDETNQLTFDLDVEDGTTNEADLYLLTWTPQALAELRTRVGDDGSFGSVRPLGPSGTEMVSGSDGSRTYTTPQGLVVKRNSDGTVDVDDTNYTP